MSERKHPDLLRISDVLVAAMDRITARTEGATPGLLTGLDALDEVIGGLQRSQLTVIGGRPSMGTTALAVNIVDHITHHTGKAVLYVTLDRTGIDLTERFLAVRANVPLRYVSPQKLPSREHMIRLGRAYNELQATPLWISAPPVATVARIAAQARLLDRLDLIVVDRLQEVESDSPQDRRAERLARVCLQLRQLARELDVPVVTLSHLRRTVERRPSHRPTCRDLDRSSAIFEASDVILLLHRPEYYDPHDTPGIAELVVAKNRMGWTRDVKLGFDRDVPRFQDLEGTRGNQEGWF